MSVVVTGAAGFLGNRLAQNLAKRGAQVVLCDQIEPPVVPAGGRALVGPLEETLEAAITSDTRAVVHLAAIVSSGAERDFDLGYRVNVDGLRGTLEACRARCAQPPKFVFASSLAVFGATDAADDATPTTPLNSYGAQKAIGELLVNGAASGDDIVCQSPPNAAANGSALPLLLGQALLLRLPRQRE